MTVLVLEFKIIEKNNKTKYCTFYSSLKAETVINESDVDNIFESFSSTIISNIQKSLGKSSD